MAAEGYCWSKTSERQVLKIRYKYLEAVLRQEVAFFDSQEATTAEINNSISKDTSLIQEVLSEKVKESHVISKPSHSKKKENIVMQLFLYIF